MSAVPGRSEEDSVVPLVWKDPAPTSTNPAGAGAKNNSAPACRTKPNERPAIEPARARRNWPPAAPDSYESTPSPYADTMKDVTRPSNCLFKKRPGSERRRVEVATARPPAQCPPGVKKEGFLSNILATKNKPMARIIPTRAITMFLSERPSRRSLSDSSFWAAWNNSNSCSSENDAMFSSLSCRASQYAWASPKPVGNFFSNSGDAPPNPACCQNGDRSCVQRRTSP